MNSGDDRCKLRKEDLAEAPSVDVFFGRKDDCFRLKGQIVSKPLRLFCLHGFPGVGKTTLVAKSVEEIKPDFEYVIWRSLQHAPALDYLISGWISFLSDSEDLSLPDTTEQKIGRLLDFLREQRCLLILDNYEALFCEGVSGRYREGYENYSVLIQRIAESNHQSCLLITSREKPTEFSRLSGNQAIVSSKELGGLDLEGAKQLLKENDVSGSEKLYESLIAFYSGNPLALKLVVEVIRELFLNDLERFLKEGVHVFADLDDLIEKPIARLSQLERDILYWLAIGREQTTLKELCSDLIGAPTVDEIQRALMSLRRRSFIESFQQGFTVQNVVMEFLTKQIIEITFKEVVESKLLLANSHALIKATAEEYIRDSQFLFILDPIARLLVNKYRTPPECIRRLRELLTSLPREAPPRPGYAAGNIVNLLLRLNADLADYDLSSLSLWQAYFRGKSLHRVNVSGSDLSKTVLTETFGAHLSVAFDSSGARLATGTTHGKIYILDVADFKPIQTLDAHSDWVRSVAFGPNENVLASGGEDQIVRLWDLKTGTIVHRLSGHSNRIRKVIFSPDGKLLASCSSDHTIRIWDTAAGTLVRILTGHGYWVRSIAFSPDGLTLASGSSDNTVRLWEVASGKCLKVLTGHTRWVRAVAFSPNNKQIATGSSDQTIRLWDAATGECVATLEGHASRVRTLSFSPDGKLLASGSGDGTIRLWHAISRTCIKVLIGHRNQIWNLSFSPNGQTIASCSEDQTLRIWEIKSGRCVRAAEGYTEQIWSVAFDATNALIAAGGGDCVLRLWDIRGGDCVRTFQGHSSWIRSIAFGEGDKFLASGSDDQTVRIWNVETSECLRILRDNSSRVRALAVSGDGQYLASGDKRHGIWVWDARSWDFLGSLMGHEGSVWTIAFSPDKQFLASGGADCSIRLWSFPAKKCVRKLRGHKSWIRSLVFQPNGSLLASAGEDGIIKLWQASINKCVKTWNAHQERIWSLAFSPDGKILASGGDDKFVHLWEAATGKSIAALKGPDCQIRSVAFSPDGEYLACGAYNGSIFVWETKKYQIVAELRVKRPYEGMTFAHATGLTDSQKESLRTFGAIANNKTKTDFHSTETVENREMKAKMKSTNVLKTVVELDLAGYSDIARELEENISVQITAQLNEQIQSFIDQAIATIGVSREQVVMGTTGDGAILLFDHPDEAHTFARSIHDQTNSYNKSKTIASAQRWFRIGAATGQIHIYNNNGERQMAGITIANAVRLEANSKIGEFLIDEATFRGLSTELQRQYGNREEVSGKRSERFSCYRCIMVAATGTSGKTSLESVLSLFDQLNPRDQLTRVMLAIEMPKEHRPSENLSLHKRQDVILDWAAGTKDGLEMLSVQLRKIIEKQGGRK